MTAPEIGPPYPEGTQAVKPPKINVSKCDHDADPPICYCVHDWRIHWGNLPRSI